MVPQHNHFQQGYPDLARPTWIDANGNGDCAECRELNLIDEGCHSWRGGVARARRGRLRVRAQRPDRRSSSSGQVASVHKRLAHLIACARSPLARRWPSSWPWSSASCLSQRHLHFSQSRKAPSFNSSPVDPCAPPGGRSGTFRWHPSIYELFHSWRNYQLFLALMTYKKDKIGSRLFYRSSTNSDKNIIKSRGLSWKKWEEFIMIYRKSAITSLIYRARIWIKNNTI